MLGFSSRTCSLKVQARKAIMSAEGSVVTKMLEVRLSNPGPRSSAAGQPYLPPASLSQPTDVPCSSSPISLYSTKG